MFITCDLGGKLNVIKPSIYKGITENSQKFMLVLSKKIFMFLFCSYCDTHYMLYCSKHD